MTVYEAPQHKPTSAQLPQPKVPRPAAVLGDNSDGCLGTRQVAFLFFIFFNTFYFFFILGAGCADE